ncbi:uncharacterized protein BP01DRAFT_162276, partial [Aspergillus saccharolyticus JOP 1030-1]
KRNPSSCLLHRSCCSSVCPSINPPRTRPLDLVLSNNDSRSNQSHSDLPRPSNMIPLSRVIAHMRPSASGASTITSADKRDGTSPQGEKHHHLPTKSLADLKKDISGFYYKSENGSAVCISVADDAATLAFRRDLQAKWFTAIIQDAARKQLGGEGGRHASTSHHLDAATIASRPPSPFFDDVAVDEFQDCRNDLSSVENDYVWVSDNDDDFEFVEVDKTDLAAESLSSSGVVLEFPIETPGTTDPAAQGEESNATTKESISSPTTRKAK